jgi:phospholipid/cholesterol/gamma-HCH transport system substrate-binding protein
MSEKRLEWKVGLFVLVCLLVLGLLVLNFSKGLTFFTPTYTLRLRTSNVGGIKREATVLMAGVQVGNVTGAELSPEGTNVTVYLKILNRYRIHRDAVFTIDSLGFLGDQYVAIIPGRNEAPILNDNDEVVCREPFNLQEVARSALGFIQRIDETAKKLDSALTRVERNVLNEETLTNFSATIASFRQVSARALATLDRLDRVVESNTLPVSATMSNLVLFSREINDLADELQQVVSTNKADWAAAVKNIESSTEMMKSLLSDLHAGKGLAGSLLNNEALSDGFSQTVSNLTVLSSNLNRHGLLWRPKKTETRPPAPLYPGRDPRR